MSEFHIRPAVPEDLETLAAYNVAMAWETEHKRLDAAVVWNGVRALLVDSRKGRYFVACVPCENPRLEGDARGERIVGQVMHTWEWSDWRNGDVWWLQSVYVHPDFRGRGVFRALLTAVLDEARRDPGVVGLRLYVERENAAAQDVYRRLGFHDAGYLVLEQMFGLERTDSAKEGSIHESAPPTMA